MSDDAQPTPAPRDDRIGTVLGERFRVLSLLGAGGVGEVYVAEQLPMGRRVALKLLRRDLARHPEIAARFEREAGALAALSHPNIVQALDFGRTPDGEMYLALELFHGESLRAWIARAGQLPLPSVLAVARQLGAALTHAHAGGFVHRDLKPENVMLGYGALGDGVHVKVLDFGMARIVGGALAGAAPLTRQGAVFGTPEYMAPEQALGRPVQSSADQYSFGVLLYEMLAGRRPFAGATPIDILRCQVHDTPNPLRALAPDVPSGVADVVHRMLQKAPDDRFGSVSEAVSALEAAARAPAPPGAPAEPARTPTLRTDAHGATGPEPAGSPLPRRAMRTAPALALAAAIVAAAIGLEAWVRSHASEAAAREREPATMPAPPAQRGAP